MERNTTGQLKKLPVELELPLENLPKIISITCKTSDIHTIL